MPKIFAISDLHLSFGVPHKHMDIFGPQWESHPQKIASAWDALITEEDFVLIAGDVSWAKKLSEALPDLEWIHSRPGTKILIKGNHDYWWDSIGAIRKKAPKSLHFIQNDAFIHPLFSIAGAKLFDSSEYSFSEISTYVDPRQKTAEEKIADEATFQKELHRLQLSLESLPKESTYKILIVHYPPISLTLKESRVSRLVDQYDIKTVVFGHLHALKTNLPPLFGKKGSATYILTSCDYCNFTPLLIASLDVPMASIARTL